MKLACPSLRLRSLSALIHRTDLFLVTTTLYRRIHLVFTFSIMPSADKGSVVPGPAHQANEEALKGAGSDLGEAAGKTSTEEGGALHCTSSALILTIIVRCQRPGRQCGPRAQSR